MPMLADHWSEGNFIPEGEHEVTVKSCKFITYNSGTKGIEFVLADNRKREIRNAFALKNEGNLKVLSSFVSACGMTREECKNYNTDVINSHMQLIGRHIMVKIEPVKGKDDKVYSEVKEWWKCEHATAPVGTPAPVVGEPEPQGESNDDLPF